MPLRTHDLDSGGTCSVEQVRSLWLRHYYVVALETDQSDPTAQQIHEMYRVALSEAHTLSVEHEGEPGWHTLISSGARSRRSTRAHIHILISGSRLEKTWLYFVLAGKNLLQAVGLRADTRYLAKSSKEGSDASKCKTVA